MAHKPAFAIFWCLGALMILAMPLLPAYPDDLAYVFLASAFAASASQAVAANTRQRLMGWFLASLAIFLACRALHDGQEKWRWRWQQAVRHSLPSTQP